ncbi:MAG: RibD family protein [Leptolyngbya sp. SIO1D8]|nr:RibD family protein [Leptolyngbya sp. SIO1D8]
MSLSLNHIWTGIGKLRESLKSLSKPFEFAVLSFQDENIWVGINELDESVKSFPSVVISPYPMNNLNGLHTRFEPDSLTEVHLRKTGYITEEQISFLKQYIPYALLPLHANKEKRTITISHFAQSLDGKIATKEGNSKWIGNEENLIHAHRMRALCDAILIGSNTLIYDNPSLTVRNVAGKDPVKVVIGKSNELDFSKLLENDARVIYITNDKNNCQIGEVETIDTKTCQGVIDCDKILKALYSRGIYSLYIEGGSKTVSNFLINDSIDVVQLHIAPLIMGSGIVNFSLPEIKAINESISFKKFNFTPMGRHIMFTGEVSRQ